MSALSKNVNRDSKAVDAVENKAGDVPSETAVETTEVKMEGDNVSCCGSCS